ncbi:hypothetical protein J120_05080 [candidate division TM6 bacterium JCVI TM6SC1]|uniref:Uncharacterized protein n=1 Tax=candidate division TM6 bacterium JCVI TM6SC1 TaxID=1306947 RepID=A0A0D2K3J1_9BACT|nr:hypothetical protein J120_05080 [candidate division TM6 bacterium JCVI TM6SC1]
MAHYELFYTQFLLQVQSAVEKLCNSKLTKQHRSPQEGSILKCIAKYARLLKKQPEELIPFLSELYEQYHPLSFKFFMECGIDNHKLRANIDHLLTINHSIGCPLIHIFLPHYLHSDRYKLLTEHNRNTYLNNFLHIAAQHYQKIYGHATTKLPIPICIYVPEITTVTHILNQSLATEAMIAATLRDSLFDCVNNVEKYVLINQNMEQSTQIISCIEREPMKNTVTLTATPLLLTNARGEKVTSFHPYTVSHNRDEKKVLLLQDLVAAFIKLYKE